MYACVVYKIMREFGVSTPTTDFNGNFTLILLNLWFVLVV